MTPTTIDPFGALGSRGSSIATMSRGPSRCTGSASSSTSSLLLDKDSWTSRPSTSTGLSRRRRDARERTGLTSTFPLVLLTLFSGFLKSAANVRSPSVPHLTNTEKPFPNPLFSQPQARHPFSKRKNRVPKRRLLRLRREANACFVRRFQFLAFQLATGHIATSTRSPEEKRIEKERSTAAFKVLRRRLRLVFALSSGCHDL